MTYSLSDLEEKCKNSVHHFELELGKIRGGRASASLLEGVQVDYYGAATPLKQLGMVSAPEANLLTVQVYDGGAVESVEKAILQSDLGLNPSRDGNLIRINIPALTEERRKDLIKTLHKMSEEAKVAVRSHRREANDALKKAEKDKELSEDDKHREEESVQKVVDASIKGIDDLLTAKESEMMEV